MNLEPIEKIDTDELTGILSLTRAHIELILKRKLQPKDQDHIIELIENNLRMMAQSIKKSIEDNFPNQKFLFNATETNEAWWFANECKRRGVYPLTEGSIAMLRIFSFLDSYRQKLSPRVIMNAFDIMRAQIVEYKASIHKYADKRIQKERSRSAGGSDRGAKKPTGYKWAILWHLENGFKRDPDALWQHFVEKHSITTDTTENNENDLCAPGVFDAEDYDVYYEPDNELNKDKEHPGFLCQRIPGISSKPRKIRFSTFQRHYYDCLKILTE